MIYQTTIDLGRLLRTMLSLLELTDYTGKQSKSVEDLKKCIPNVIAEISVEESRNGHIRQEN
jgi:hypothetical protein